MEEFKHEYYLVDTSLYHIEIYDKLKSFGWLPDEIAEIRLIHTNGYYELIFDDYYLCLLEQSDWGMSIDKRRKALLDALGSWGPLYQNKPEKDATLPEFEGLGIF